MHAAIVPSSNITAYIMRVDVELRHDGHAEQHRLHAALPQQHASCSKNNYGRFLSFKQYSVMIYLNLIMIWRGHF
jgi:hypothetical protein